MAEAMVGVSGKAPTAFNNALSDSDGRFAVPALADGKYTLTVQRESFAPASQDVVVSGGVAPDVEVRLQGGTSATFVVIDAATGTVLTAASVWVDSAGKRIGSGVIRSEDGVRLWLLPGRYTAGASAYGYASTTKIELTVPGPSASRWRAADRW